MKKVLLPLAVVAALLAIWEVLAQTGALADLLGIRESVSDVIVPAPSMSPRRSGTTASSLSTTAGSRSRRCWAAW